MIIHKILAGRAVDQEDVRNILIKNKDDVDFGYIEKWLKKLGTLHEYKSIKACFLNLKRSLGIK